MFKKFSDTILSEQCLVIMAFILMMSACSPSDKKEDTSADEPVVLDPHEFKAKLEDTQDAVLIDVRTPEEVAEGAIEGAVNIDYQDNGFSQGIDTLDRNKNYFVYCLSGKRSADAIEEMQKAGFKNIFTLKDGYRNWKDQGMGKR